jgi:hypothetical protein
MSCDLHKKFQKIGAEVEITPARSNQVVPVTLDVVTSDGRERFAIRLRAGASLDLTVLEVKPEDRHLVLLAREVDADGNTIEANHFLCGHDERHLFVAGVANVSTVAQAKASLKPQAIVAREVGLSTAKRNRRKTGVFRRQGEWFFVPVDITADPMTIRLNEPLTRDARSKPHIAQFAFRNGGESVRVCARHPNGLTTREYEKLIARNPKAANYNWRTMVRNPELYVRGTIRHTDHRTITLNGWHRVLINTERRAATRMAAVTFLD